MEDKARLIKEIKKGLPIQVVYKNKIGRPRTKGCTLIGFEKDPLGVSGYMGLIPEFECAYFKEGGWIMVSDLLNQYKFIGRT